MARERRILFLRGRRRVLSRSMKRLIPVIKEWLCVAEREYSTLSALRTRLVSAKLDRFLHRRRPGCILMLDNLTTARKEAERRWKKATNRAQTYREELGHLTYRFLQRDRELNLMQLSDQDFTDSGSE